MSGTNPTTKTEAHNSVPFITKDRADAYYSITSTIIWKWASKTIHREVFIQSPCLHNN